MATPPDQCIALQAINAPKETISGYVIGNSVVQSSAQGGEFFSLSVVTPLLFEGKIG